MISIKRCLCFFGAMVGALACVACGAQSTPPPPALPSPTIAAARIPPTPVFTPTPPPARPTTAAQQPAAPTGALASDATPEPAAEPTIYLWPSYLPDGMQPAPAESRVSGEQELGEGDLGFYLVTLNGEGKKLAIGGGGLKEELPLGGDKRPITVGQRTGTLITNGDQREVVLNVARGKLFVYSFGLAEDELVRVAESLQPIDVRTLRELAAPK